MPAVQSPSGPDALTSVASPLAQGEIPSSPPKAHSDVLSSDIIPVGPVPSQPAAPAPTPPTPTLKGTRKGEAPVSTPTSSKLADLSFSTNKKKAPTSTLASAGLATSLTTRPASHPTAHPTKHPSDTSTIASTSEPAVQPTITGQPDPELTLATAREIGNIIFSSPLPAAAASVLDQVRVPQYGHLKGLALYGAIKDLPDWQQMQEMTPWFGPLSIVLRYLSTHERYTYLFDVKHKSGKDALKRLTEMGFPVRPDMTRLRMLDSLQKTMSSILRQLELPLKFLQSHKPPVLCPPTGLEEVTITIPGPVDCSYTVVNQPLAKMKSNQNSGSKRPKARGDCVLAIMEHFQDQKMMVHHYTLAFLRLRAICPDLKPWGIGQSILDTNPGILENSFIFRECFQSFWGRNYGSRTSTKRNEDTTISTWCREHQCLERYEILRSLHLQLSLGLFSYKESVFLVSEIWDDTQRPGHHTDYEGSHGCHNGVSRADDTINIVCISPCDVLWETTINNGQRKGCHNLFRNKKHNTDAELQCFCPLGKQIPCMVHKCNQTADDVRKKVFDFFARIKHKVGRCPICPDKEIFTINKLSDCFDTDINHDLITHLNVVQGAELVRIS